MPLLTERSVISGEEIGASHNHSLKQKNSKWLTYGKKGPLPQGSGLRNITRSPKVPSHEIMGVQHLSLYEKVFFLQLPEGKSCSWSLSWFCTMILVTVYLYSLIGGMLTFALLGYL